MLQPEPEQDVPAHVTTGVTAGPDLNFPVEPDFPPVSLPLIIKERWKFKARIGQGSFGAVFSGRDLRTGAKVAVKLEPVTARRSLLKTEVGILKELQGSDHICRYVASGFHRPHPERDGFNYLIMELLADNLAQNFRQQRRSRAAEAGQKEQSTAADVSLPAEASQAEQRFTSHALTFTQAAFLGRQLVKSLESLHDHGFLHRDVKPSNFALGMQPDRISTCYVIDFGLARRYIDDHGAHRPPRDKPGFRGTARYASPHAHLQMELGRRDDLWSVFFIMFEFMVGSLPWSALSDRDEIGLAKQQWFDDVDGVLSPVFMLPHPLPAMFAYLQTLDYADRPDYRYFSGLLEQPSSGPPSEPFSDPPSDPTSSRSTEHQLLNAGTGTSHYRHAENNLLTPPSQQQEPLAIDTVRLRPRPPPSARPAALPAHRCGRRARRHRLAGSQSQQDKGRC